MTAQAGQVLALLADGDADEAIAALIAAERNGHRFTFTPNGDGVTVTAAPS